MPTDESPPSVDASGPPSSRAPASDGPRSTAKLTPVMRQFEEAKRQHPDAIIFFRLGDFYEMFHEDAVLAAGLLKLTLTARHKNSPSESAMCGVPYHAVHGYIAKLLAFGHKVAICEQMADPSKVKGIVPREVVRVITPGLVTSDSELDARENNFLVGISEDEGSFGVAWLDLSTGELAAAEVAGPADVLAELSRLAPREILLSEKARPIEEAVRQVLPGAVVRNGAVREDEARLAELLGAEAFGDAKKNLGPHAIAASTIVLDFSALCLPRANLPVRRIVPMDRDQVLRIDDVAQVHLELVRNTSGGKESTLLHVVDRTVTPMGARLLRARILSPLLDPEAIRRRLDDVELFVVHPGARDEARRSLAEVPDLERLVVRAELAETSPRDLASMRDGLAALPRVAKAIATIPDPLATAVAGDLGAPFPLAAELARALADRPMGLLRDGGVIRTGFDAELDAARKTKDEAASLLVALETRLRQETDAPVKVRYNGVFGYFIEVTKSHLKKVPDSWRRKQTVAQGERYTTDALDDLAADIESAEERAGSREAEIFHALVARVAEEGERLRRFASRVAMVDVAAALAEVAHQHDFVKPDVDDGEAIVIEEGRHPVVERAVARGRFVPNDTTLDLADKRLWLVTGPNMAGKSTLMRQVALIVILAQAGSYVPARRARIGVVDKLFSRVGASDNLARGESTFMVEMRETASILRHATRKSLVVLDEIGRGTSTYDGLSIAWAVAEHLHDVVGCRALFATHYHELTELAAGSPGAVNVSVAAREHEGDVVFLHALVKGPASRSYGIAVAKLAGLPESVLARARAMLEELEGKASRGESIGQGGRKKASPQLDLFAKAPVDGEAGPLRETAATLRAVDIDRMTPLDALALVAKLKTRLS